ncbi:hypothetical protein [Luteimonas sp. SDU82]|uniref:hypothetical protein n=1 Tax=Luteimonas sp. SDU82 TaxID=3422592 RepID=UPI003EBC4A21
MSNILALPRRQVLARIIAQGLPACILARIHIALAAASVLRAGNGLRELALLGCLHALPLPAFAPGSGVGAAWLLVALRPVFPALAFALLRLRRDGRGQEHAERQRDLQRAAKLVPFHVVHLPTPGRRWHQCWRSGNEWPLRLPRPDSGGSRRNRFQLNGSDTWPGQSSTHRAVLRGARAGVGFARIRYR